MKHDKNQFIILYLPQFKDAYFQRSYIPVSSWSLVTQRKQMWSLNGFTLSPGSSLILALLLSGTNLFGIKYIELLFI